MKYGRTLPTWEEEEAANKNDSFFYEFFCGPPGHNRVRYIVGGSALLFGGLLGLISVIIRKLS